IDGAQLAIRAGRRHTHSPCTILGADGRPVSGSVLLAGTPYVVSLHAPRGGHCRRITTLATDLALGAAVTGFQALGVKTSDDAGRSWKPTVAATVGGTLLTHKNVCGDGRREGREQCDGSDDAACPGRCTATCKCASTTTTTPVTTTTTLPPGSLQAPFADGYLGFYDPSTIPLWPQRMILMLGEANAQGPLIAQAKQVAASA